MCQRLLSQGPYVISTPIKEYILPNGLVVRLTVSNIDRMLLFGSDMTMSALELTQVARLTNFIRGCLRRSCRNEVCREPSH